MEADTSEVEEIARRLRNGKLFVQTMEPYFREAVTDFVDVVRAVAPKQTGRLRAATFAKFPGEPPLTAVVGTDDSVCKYAKWVHAGIDHKVWVGPVNKKALSWSAGGFRFFSGGHFLPPRKANPYLDRAWERGRRDYIESIEKGLALTLSKETDV